jgi:hypothetical protein
MHFIGTLLLLRKGAMYFETRKHDLVVKCTTSLFFLLYGKTETVSSSRLRAEWLSSPRVNAGAFRRDLVTFPLTSVS